MNCPKCGGNSDVIDGRATSYGFRRRRECRDCKHRWPTVELICPEGQLARTAKICKQGSALVDLFTMHIDNLSGVIDNIKQSLKEF